VFAPRSARAREAFTTSLTLEPAQQEALGPLLHEIAGLIADAAAPGGAAAAMPETAADDRRWYR
jgi:hypothetical protein